MEYYAHYDKKLGTKQKLIQHMKNTADVSVSNVPPVVSINEIDNYIIKNIVKFQSIFHDLGKYTKYFQNYLLYGVKSSLKNHAHISSCFVYNFLNRELSKYDIPDVDRNIITFLCYVCVRQHHMGLSINSMLFPDSSESMWNELENIRVELLNHTSDILSELKCEGVNANTFESFLNIKKLRNNKRNFIYMPIRFNSGRIKNSNWYFILIYLFSTLIDSDKMDSACIKSKRICNVKHDRVREYIKNKNSNKKENYYTRRREKARTSIIKTIDNMTDNEIVNTKIFFLTAPTGIGKTLSSIEAALLLQERIKANYEYVPRIITAIPFINIVEQTREEYENIFKNNIRLIIHHRLSDFTKANNKENMSVDKSLLEVEAWEGDVVVTTFVQFFQSLFTGRNRALKKINKIAGSIVILDEIQGIPEIYMPIVGAAIIKISEIYGTRFILMTATQPKIIDMGKLLLGYSNVKSIQLLKSFKEYFKDLKRTCFKPMVNKKISTDEFINLFISKLECNKSVLIVVNTIKRSIEVYNKVKSEFKKQNIDIPVFYLSTNITPKDRKNVINTVKCILEHCKPVVLVSTQTIEAGVDLDFDFGFRDFAPLDSLIQTAGRINREGKKGKFNPLYIVRLESDNNYIYDLMHRDSTINIIKGKECILETEYGALVEQYYNEAIKRGVSPESKEIWNEGILKLNFDIIEKFKLIDNPGEVCDVFVEQDEDAIKIADAYTAVLLNSNDIKQKLEDINIECTNCDTFSFFERKALIKLIQAKMNDYIIQIRVNKLIKNKPFKFSQRMEIYDDIISTLFWIPEGQIEDYYNKNTGFIDDDGGAFIF